MLKVSPRKGVIRFGKRGKLNPHYIGLFKTLKRVSPMAYTLELPKEFSNVHNTFYVSNLTKCLSHESLVIPMKELRLKDKLNFMEELIEIIDREVKQQKQRHITIVKVRWNSKRGPEFTWECKIKFMPSQAICSNIYFYNIRVGNKMHKAFPLPGESSHWQYKFSLPVNVVPTARRLEMPLPGVCTAIEEMMKKLPVKNRWQLH
uniref:Putative reverse transcriptase domain-containing protein n=1 Tax=Tanacetum cinerariifolium TaxID=118510 RepID=A0A699KXN0_TANCI|nr:putative reverse transcriptase domain-containing protein [Tanacetum cinerariifolium]